MTSSELLRRVGGGVVDDGDVEEAFRRSHELRPSASPTTASIASTSSGSSGATFGENRVTEPSGQMRNFSKFHLMSSCALRVGDIGDRRRTGRPAAVDIDLREHRERDAVLGRAELLDFGGARLLAPELVAREAEHAEALVAYSLAAAPALCTAASARTRRDVDDQHRVALVLGEGRRPAVQGVDFVLEDRHRDSMPLARSRSGPVQGPVTAATDTAAWARLSRRSVREVRPTRRRASRRSPTRRPPRRGARRRVRGPRPG